MNAATSPQLQAKKKLRDEKQKNLQAKFLELAGGSPTTTTTTGESSSEGLAAAASYNSYQHGGGDIEDQQQHQQQGHIVELSSSGEQPRVLREIAKPLIHNYTQREDEDNYQSSAAETSGFLQRRMEPKKAMATAGILILLYWWL